MEKTSTCPKCNYVSTDEEFSLCPKCGIIIKKYYETLETRQKLEAERLERGEKAEKASQVKAVQRNRKKSDILRFLGISIGAIFILNMYPVFFLPLHLSHFVLMLIGLLLMSSYSWLVASIFKGDFSTVSNIGLLCFSFFILAFAARGRNIVAADSQGSISSKMFIGLLIIYIVLKVKQKTKKN